MKIFKNVLQKHRDRSAQLEALSAKEYAEKCQQQDDIVAIKQELAQLKTILTQLASNQQVTS